MRRKSTDESKPPLYAMAIAGCLARLPVVETQTRARISPSARSNRACRLPNELLFFRLRDFLDFAIAHELLVPRRQQFLGFHALKLAQGVSQCALEHGRHLLGIAMRAAQ